MGNTDSQHRMYTAISSDNEEEVSLLIKQFPHLLNCPISDDNCTTALTRAGYLNRTDIVSMLLERGATVDSSGVNRKTALMWAAAKGHLECCRILVLHNASLCKRDLSGMTALGFSILNGRESTTRFLTELGVSIDKALEETQRKTGMDLDNDMPLLLHQRKLTSNENLEILLDIGIEGKN